MDDCSAQSRLSHLLAEEAGQPERSWWLSFCDPGKPNGHQFLGVAIVKAPGFMHAVDKAHVLGINPGGEVKGMPFDDIASEHHDKLMSLAELQAAGLVAQSH